MGVIAPQTWLLVLGARKLGLESLPTPLTASPLPPMASTHSHPHPSHQPPHPSQAWLSGERSSPSPGTVVKPRARGLRSRAQRSRVCFWPCHLTPQPSQLGPDFLARGWVSFRSVAFPEACVRLGLLSGWFSGLATEHPRPTLWPQSTGR